MLEQNNSKKTAGPTTKIKILNFQLKRNIPSLILIVYNGVFLVFVCNWRDVPGYQESSKILYRHQHESDRKDRIRG